MLELSWDFPSDCTFLSSHLSPWSQRNHLILVLPILLPPAEPLLYQFMLGRYPLSVEILSYLRSDPHCYLLLSSINIVPTALTIRVYCPNSVNH